MKTIRRFELKIRRVSVGEQPALYGRRVAGPDDVVHLARQLIGDAGEERFCAFYLDVKNKVLGFSEIGRGGIDQCPVDVASTFRAAIAVGASGLIASHNHPSGQVEPSREDLVLTERLKQAGELLGIRLLDHVVVTEDDACSLAARGLL